MTGAGDHAEASKQGEALRFLLVYGLQRLKYGGSLEGQSRKSERVGLLAPAVGLVRLSEIL